MNILVKKEDGSVEKFDEMKLAESIKKNGGSEEIVEDILKSFKEVLKKEITSNKIYETAQKILLEKGDKKTFLRYNLPQSIYKLGPEGFAFEKFIGEVFESYGYSPVYIGKKISGKCGIIHEMDVVTYKENETVTAELKFHNSRSKRSDLKVALYMKSRFDDILNSGFYEGKTPRQMIITNTKFTNNARNYANCVGLEMIGWNHPENNNLYDFILNSGIHPITAVGSISKKAKEYFLKRKIVSCHSVMKNNKKALNENPFVSKDKMIGVVEEIKDICFHLGKEKRKKPLGNVD